MARRDKKATPTRAIRVFYHPDALAEVQRADPEFQAQVVAVVSQLNGRPHTEIVALLDRRTERKVAQWEGSHKRGALRIVFFWAKEGLCVLGAFVKQNDKHGERLVRRILPRAEDLD